MKLTKCDIFSLVGTVDALAITTNGCVKKDGTNVMGKGVAKKANELWPGLNVALGSLIKINGNHVHIIINIKGTCIISFPTKPESMYILDDSDLNQKVVSYMRPKMKVASYCPGWACKSDLQLIDQSCAELKALTDDKGWKSVALPKPGCACGELMWEEVSVILSNYFDDKFLICNLEEP